MAEEGHKRPVVTVHECYNDGEAEIVLALLRDRGIEGFANSEVPHSILPLTTDGLGKVSILVDEDLAEKARAIISESTDQGTS